MQEATRGGFFFLMKSLSVLSCHTDGLVPFYHSRDYSLLTFHFEPCLGVCVCASKFDEITVYHADVQVFATACLGFQTITGHVVSSD